MAQLRVEASISDAKHLQWLRDDLGERVIGGAVLHSGPRRYPLSDGIVAAPICSLRTRP